MIFPETKEKKARGLSFKEALESREKYGSNIITEIKKKGFWKHLLSNLNDPIIRILIGALLVNLIFIFRTSDWIETAGIAISILLSAFISTISERGSETAFSRLNAENENYFCRVVRDGEVHNHPISEIVCGDLIKISAGDKIPADGHIISGKLSVDQSAMTGESAEIEKAPSKEFRIHPSCPSALLRGCTVISGEC
jgi:magnesium-transporting ATPase (P-type)